MPHFLFLAVADERLSWVVYALGGVSLIYLVMVRPMLARRKRDPLSEVPKFGLASQREIERQMNSLLVELSEMARQISAQLDTRAKKLELLIDEADRRIALLNQEKPAELAAERSGPAGPLPMNRASTEALARHAEIYKLADEGRSATEIAATLNRPRGEIELILALRPRDGFGAGGDGGTPVQG